MTSRKPRKAILSTKEKMDAERLKKAWERLAKGTKRSQKELSLLWRVNPSLISQYINGHIPLNVETKLKFAQYLHCNVLDIWPDFEFVDVMTMTWPPTSLQAAKAMASISEDDQAAVMRILNSLPRVTH